MNGGFDNRLASWAPTSGNDTATVAETGPYCSDHSVELATLQGANSAGVSLNQWLNYGGCNTSTIPPQTFGLALKNGLVLSVWHRSLNSSETRYGVAVTFHNGTSKLAIDYLLAFRGVPPSGRVDKDLREGIAEVLVNSSSLVWQKSIFNLTTDFMKYFRVDPIARHYCINYVSLWQAPLSFNYFGQIPTVNYKTGSHSDSYFNDVELYLST
jgi:hypothetical protein